MQRALSVWVSTSHACALLIFGSASKQNARYTWVNTVFLCDVRSLSRDTEAPPGGNGVSLKVAPPRVGCERRVQLEAF